MTAETVSKRMDCVYLNNKVGVPVVVVFNNLIGRVVNLAKSNAVGGYCCQICNYQRQMPTVID